MLYSKTGLYVLMDGTDAKVTATYIKDFDTLWMEDVYEAFLWPDEKHPIYFEYEISPLNRELPILVPNLGGQIMGWRPWMYDGPRKTRKAVHTEGGEARDRGRNPRLAGGNFFRTSCSSRCRTPRKKGRNGGPIFTGWTTTAGKTSSWDWSRVGPSFHEYQKFGTLEFE